MTIGMTKDAGWQIGVRTTFDHPVTAVWHLLTSPEGLALWLGDGLSIAGEPGESYETRAGTTGEIRSFHPEDRIRLTWQPQDWDHETTVQLVVRAAGDRTRLTLHQERLADADERERQRTHWKRVADLLADALAEANPG